MYMHAQTRRARDQNPLARAARRPLFQSGPLIRMAHREFTCLRA